MISSQVGRARLCLDVSRKTRKVRIEFNLGILPNFLAHWELDSSFSYISIYKSQV